MNKIKRIFENKRKIFIAYIVCGDPDIKTTLALMRVLAESGVDIIELGMPFTDPIADGPVIQKSVERALQNNTSLNDVFSTVNSFKKSHPDVPVVLMGYLNPIENLTYKKFSSLSKKNNVDGVLIVDSPPEESECLNYSLKSNGISQIFLASPTTDDERLKKIIKSTNGYLYYVSLKGITGSKLNKYTEIEKNIKKLKKLSKNSIPIAVGFGIKDKTTAKKMSKISDGIIIGSSIVDLIEKNHHNKSLLIKKVKAYVSSIRRSIN